MHMPSSGLIKSIKLNEMKFAMLRINMSIRTKEQFALTAWNNNQSEFLRNGTCTQNDKVNDQKRKDESLRMVIWDHQELSIDNCGKKFMQFNQGSINNH